MSQSRKRLFKNLSDIDSPQKSAELHFAIESLSPIKEAKSGIKYFDANVSDNTKKMRLVSFDTQMQQQLAKLHENKTPVKLENCQVKQNKGRSDEFELHVNRATVISPSPKKITIPDNPTTAPVPHVTLSDLWTIEEGKPVNITAKVTSIKPARVVTTGILQELTVDDDSSSTTLTVWGPNVDKLEVIGLTLKRDSSYEESTVSIEGSQSQNDDEDGSISCINCSSKLGDITNMFSQCTNCSLYQFVNIEDIQLSANLLLKDVDNQQFFLKCGTEVIKSIISPVQISVHNLSQTQEHISYCYYSSG